MRECSCFATASRPTVTLAHAISLRNAPEVPSWGLLLGGWAVIVAALLSLPAATAQESLASEPDIAERLGIEGHYRAGHWASVRLPPQHGGSVELETTDGDGVAVVYQQEFLQASHGQGPTSSFAYAIPGTEAAPLILRSRDSSSAAQASGEDAGGEVIWDTRFAEVGVPAEGPSMVPVGMPWAVVIGNPLGIDTIGANELLDRSATVAVTRVDEAGAVPDHVLGFSGVDLMLITAEGTDVLSGLSAAQGEAIASWVRGGGRLFVTLGAKAGPLLEAAGWLAELLPDQIVESSVVSMDPSGFETFTNSQTRLQGFDAWQFPKVIGAGGTTLSRVGEVLIAGRTSRRIGLPLAIRYAAGMGKITLVAADLDAAPFTQWPERLDLVTKLTGDVLSEKRSEVGSSFRVSGYSDLSGQVRRSLDHFPIKRSVGFSIIALIIAGLVALVAPLDYLVVRRVFGNPLLGWMTFPIVAVLLSVALVMAAAPRVELDSSVEAAAAEKDPLLRQRGLEILDVDGSTRTTRLFHWSYLYSHPAQSVNVRAVPSEPLAELTDTTTYQVLQPFGAPGREMGGIQIDAWNAPIHVPLMLLDPPRESQQGQGEPSLTSRIDSLELAPRSSKSLALQMQLSTHVNASPVQRRRGSELLQGELINPFPVDLLDAMLIYQNWVYFLPTRFPASATIEDIDSLRQKNFRWQLSRQRALESSSQTEAWDVTQTNQPVRLAEMVMFHGVVGGTRYTGLQNEILGHLDWTDLLNEDRCILVARCRDPWTTLSIEADTQEPSPAIVPPGETDSWVRIVLPVEEGRRE
ncbi:hypothetical protein [Allorhodopirellula solitaria]|uniref:DUF4350 domain-containing protein n=1 Tax=Allorhodopirellula solitaria TaxID=2527987 RepID=A0A5C5YIP0_9BACT|nr:hypothetical protein [Allorhodopirellula solitaria]TWT74736.1 hypothetical protein CA85_00210 [Allorhodopirellula solitaria]